MASYLQNNLLTIPIHQFSIATFFLMGGIWLQSFTSHAIFLTMPSLLAIIIILMLLSLLKKIHWDTLVRKCDWVKLNQMSAKVSEKLS